MDGAHLQSRLADLLTESRAVELERFDDVDSSTILHRVVPEFSELLRRGRSLLGAIEESCASSEPAAGAWAVPGRVEELETLCFFVEGEWKRALEGLERLGEATPGWNCLMQIERARDRLVRGLTAVERELAAAAGEASRTDHVDLLRDALQVRRVLTLFRREIQGASPSRAGADDLDHKLRRAGSALERLIDREEFSRLRAADWHLARDLQRRVDAWLREGSRSPDSERDSEPDSGGPEGLWQDVVNFAALLWDVNRRDELVEADLAVTDGVIRELESPSSPRKLLPASVAHRLRPLFGRDDELDDLLEATAETDWVLERLRTVRESLAKDRLPQLG